MSRVTELLKSAVELNLRYTSTLLHLSKDYLKDANTVLTRPPQATPSPPDEPVPAQRPPLLVVGRSGEVGNAAFAINNPGDKEMNVHLVVQGELDERVVTVEPARLTLKGGDGAIVRILARFDDKLPLDKDHVGTVVAPGLTSQGVPFIVRRLPDPAGEAPSPQPTPDPAPKKRASRNGNT